MDPDELSGLQWRAMMLMASFDATHASARQMLRDQMEYPAAYLAKRDALDRAAWAKTTPNPERKPSDH